MHLIKTANKGHHFQIFNIDIFVFIKIELVQDGIYS